jgi:hypothetical protein
MYFPEDGEMEEYFYVLGERQKLFDFMETFFTLPGEFIAGDGSI